MRTIRLLSVTLITLSIVSCGLLPNAGPTATLKIFIDGLKERQPEKVKGVLTSNSLKMLESGARQNNMTVDEFIKSGKAAPPVEVTEYRNEKIEGDQATVEAKAGDAWDKFFLIKEDGKWKVALDKS